jgi:hypothetical protein
MDIPASSRRRDHCDSASDSESDREAPRRTRKAKMRPRQDPPANIGMYHHTTRPRNVPGIDRHGLIRGGGPDTHGGIGDGYGNPSSDAVYVSRPGHHVPDGMGADVLVASRRSPQRDPLYPGGGAGMFYDNVPPMRNAWRDPSIPTASATFPMTPHTASGAAAMIRHQENRHLTPQQAAGAMYNGFNRDFPIRAPHPEDMNQYYTPQSQFQPHPSTVPAFSPVSPGYSSPYGPPTTGPIGGFTPPQPRFWPRDDGR